MILILLSALWAIAATAIVLLPRRAQRRGTVALVVAGVPLLGWLTLVHGPLAGLIGLIVGASMLHWPPFGIGSWLRRKVLGRG
ncbi:MAG: DUF2484 family protein [Alkalilacustris sp.]